jgi:hypothetical protein
LKASGNPVGHGGALPLIPPPISPGGVCFSHASAASPPQQPSKAGKQNKHGVRARPGAAGRPPQRGCVHRAPGRTRLRGGRTGALFLVACFKQSKKQSKPHVLCLARERAGRKRHGLSTEVFLTCHFSARSPERSPLGCISC